MVRSVALLLTILTGFSGLVYQVAWQKILAALLGSHSEATCAVLGIFLGGLSLGYWLFGHVSRWLVARAPKRARPPGLLLAYGLVEAGIGLHALLFPWLFSAVRAASLQLPHASGGISFAWDVLLTALLIAPPTILMGGTIPLLTQGLSRSLEDATRFHAWVYAFNTAGAFAGALAGGFVLVPQLGLEGAVLAMGCLNLGAGLVFLGLHRHEVAERPAATAATASVARVLPEGFLAYAAVALLAGFALMTLQTAMNRVGALALGASQFTFAMVVATFVLCIALGSFAVSALRRIRPVYLPLSQWGLVAYLLALYASVENAPYWARVLLQQFEGAAEFYPFYGAVFLWIFAVLLVPLALSGALLPLLFHHLRHEAADLGDTAGRLYSWNTVGSLLGALVGGYLLLFWVDLHVAYRIAVLALAAAAAILTLRIVQRGWIPAAAGLALAALAVALLPAWEPGRLASGLFRLRRLPEAFSEGPDALFARHPLGRQGVKLLFHSDDPAASVAVWDTSDAMGERSRSIVTNGKTDGNVPGDNLTTGLLALLPALFAEPCERAFVIGYGTGMSAGELAALETTEEVVVAEIARGVIEAAPLFEEFNRGATASPKTRLVRGDAYRTLLRSDARYDVIVSEPSNPWVAGVEMLYSLEFLQAARKRLSPGGVYAQWFHTYETDATSMALVLRTFREAFGRVSVWYGGPLDLVILGFGDAGGPVDLARLERHWRRPDFRAQLAAFDLGTLPRLLAHEALPLGVLHAMALPDEVHTVMHPLLSHTAARAFYRGDEARLPPGLARAAAEVGARHSLAAQYRRRYGGDGGHGGTLADDDRLELLRETCKLHVDRCATLFAQWLHEQPSSEVLAATLAKARTDARLAPALDPRLLERLSSLFGPDATAAMAPSWELARDLARVFTRYYHHAAPFHAGSLHSVWRRCADRDARCAAALEQMTQQGIGPRLLSQR